MKQKQISYYSQINIIQNNHSTLSINNINISQVNQTKLLGQMIDDKLKWTEHIKVIHQRALYAINKANLYMSKSNLKMLYHTLVYPHFTYDLMIWGGAHETYSKTKDQTKENYQNNKLFKIRGT